MITRQDTTAALWNVLQTETTLPIPDRKNLPKRSGRQAVRQRKACCHGLNDIEFLKKVKDRMSEEVAELEALKAWISGLPQRPSWQLYFMSVARLLSARSTCQRLHVGCVLVSDEQRIIATGYNGFLAKLPHRSVVRDNHEQLTVHAEQNAITDAARRGVSIQNATAYVTHFPCIHCAKLLLATGIRAVYFHEDYHNDALVTELFAEADVPLERFQ